MHCVLEIKRGDQRRQVIGVGVQVVAVPSLTRAAVATAIVSDTSVAACGKKEHLVLERIRGQRPAVAEYHGLTAPPIVVIDLGSVFDANGVHDCCSQGSESNSIYDLMACDPSRRTPACR